MFREASVPGTAAGRSGNMETRASQLGRSQLCKMIRVWNNGFKWRKFNRTLQSIEEINLGNVCSICQYPLSVREHASCAVYPECHHAVHLRCGLEVMQRHTQAKLAADLEFVARVTRLSALLCILPPWGIGARTISISRRTIVTWIRETRMKIQSLFMNAPNSADVLRGENASNGTNGTSAAISTGDNASDNTSVTATDMMVIDESTTAVPVQLTVANTRIIHCFNEVVTALSDIRLAYKPMKCPLCRATCNQTDDRLYCIFSPIPTSESVPGCHDIRMYMRDPVRFESDYVSSIQRTESDMDLLCDELRSSRNR